MSYLMVEPDILYAEREAEWLHAQLAAAGFADAPGARRALQRLARTWRVGEAESRTVEVWRHALPSILAALSRTASPDRALLNLERLADGVRSAEDTPNGATTNGDREGTR